MRFLYAMKIMEQETVMAGFLSQSDKIPPDRIKRSVTTKMSSDMKEAADTCLIVVRRADRPGVCGKICEEEEVPVCDRGGRRTGCL